MSDDSRLPQGVRAILEAPDNEICVSAATGWEIAIKRTLGKLSAPPDLVSLIVEEGFRELPISFADGERAGQLPLLHRDPFDRMLIAQSQAHNLTILTRDDDIPRYDVRTYWA
ncbi:type II toxin-antitoxin system VapC family toxin [Polycyclovorans algicola]|uniref:type II toxin-antitoxin system VapC family toxin n=1 Tax=Polycyclovorans algicola TaxID=616992 RepID=UPI000694CF65